MGNGSRGAFHCVVEAKLLVRNLESRCVSICALGVRVEGIQSVSYPALSPSLPFPGLVSCLLKHFAL